MKYVHDTERIGCRIYKYFIYFLGWFSFLTPFVLSGILLEPEHGAWLGMSLAVVLTLIYALLGDRLILSCVEAQDLSRNRALQNKRNNFCYLLGLGPVEIYESFILSKDVLAVQGPRQRRLVIMGSELLRSFGQREMDSLLLAALCEFKKGAPASRRLITLFYLPYALILTLAEKLFGAGLVTSFLSFFFYPAWLIHEALLDLVKNESDYNISSLEGVTEISHVQPSLYRLGLIQSTDVNQDCLEKYLKGFSLAHEQAGKDLIKTQGTGTYGKQE